MRAESGNTGKKTGTGLTILQNLADVQKRVIQLSEEFCEESFKFLKIKAMDYSRYS